MCAFPTDILIEKAGGKEHLSDMESTVKALLAKNVLKSVAGGDAQVPEPIDAATTKSLQETLHLLELRCIDLARAWQHDSRSAAGVEFRESCSCAFDIRRILPPAELAQDRVKDALRLAAAGILGDRSDDVRRHLSEIDWPVPATSEQDAGWPQMVLFGVADAFLRVARKQSWDDLRAVARAIGTLRNSQKSCEQEYLQQENGIRQVAALELVALYQLAKAVEILGEFAGKGTPQTALGDVDFHLSRAVQAADTAGIVELALLLRWIQMAAHALIRSSVWHQPAAAKQPRQT